MDVKTYLLQKRTKAAFVEQSKVHALRQKPNLFKVAYIIVPILHLCRLLLTKEVDTKKILSFGFDQIMPVLLLLVFAVTALEVGSESSLSDTTVHLSHALSANVDCPMGIKQHHKATTKGASLTSETTPNPDATTEVSTARGGTLVQPGHSSRRASFATGNDEQDISQALYLRPEPNCSVTDIASTTGLIRTDSLTGSLGAPSRTNTLGVEEGSHVSWSCNISIILDIMGLRANTKHSSRQYTPPNVEYTLSRLV